MIRFFKKDSLPSEDLEPEYITVDGKIKTAYVSLQEANAIATLDLASGEFTSVKGLGFMVYDITSPQTQTFVNYTNTRDFSGDYLGDSGPESIDFIPAEISKTGYPLVLVSNEISGN
ncbi:MAG: hypothetical protein RR128_05430 [Clostridium sp.]